MKTRAFAFLLTFTVGLHAGAQFRKGTVVVVLATDKDLVMAQIAGLYT
jgi:hypothetical protein